MKSIENLKEEMFSTIEAKLQKEINRINNEKEVILNSQSLPGILTCLVNIYGNTIEQGELQVKVVQSMSTSEFFKSSKASVKTNHIVFESDSHKVLIPKSFSKIISVERQKDIFVPRKPTFSAFIKKTVDLYLAQGENFNYKDFIDTYLIEVKKIKPTFISRRKVKESDVLRMLKKAESDVIDFELKMKKWEEELIQIEIEKKNDISFVNSIKEDLKVFEESGWKVSIEIESYKEYKNMLSLFE